MILTKDADEKLQDLYKIALREAKKMESREKKHLIIRKWLKDTSNSRE